MRELLSHIREILNYFDDSGIEYYRPVGSSPRVSGSATPASPAPVPPVSLLSPFERLNALFEEVKACKGCRLGESRKNLVFGEGNPDADLMFVGEAPGEQEDLQGFPFVGPAGDLLTKIIAAMGLKRSDVYIANIIKCRPENNRTPLPDEVGKCYPVLLRQIEIISPKIICALGSPSANTLLNTTEGVTKLRGRFHDMNGIKIMPTFHPAYLLRNESAKKTVWEDIQKIMNFLEKERRETQQ